MDPRYPIEPSRRRAQPSENPDQLSVLFENLDSAITRVTDQDESHWVYCEDFWLSELAFPLPHGSELDDFPFIMFVIDFDSFVSAVQYDDAVGGQGDAGGRVQLGAGDLVVLPHGGGVCGLRFGDHP